MNRAPRIGSFNRRRVLSRIAVEPCGLIDRASRPTRLYRFHCTDGHELVTDLCGSRLPDGAPMRAHAERVALALMERVVERFDWSGWQVEVYDAKGRRVWIRAFPDVNVDTRAA